MIQKLQSAWVAIAIGLITYVVTTWFTLQPARQLRLAVGAKADQTTKTQKAVPSWAFFNPELSQAMTELKEQREGLAVRARELDELEARLKAERQEIYSVTQTVFQLRTELDSMVTRVTEEEATNLKRLAKMYTAMTPEGASRILVEMDDAQIVKILSLMKDTDAARFLESIAQGGKTNSLRALAISNRLRLTLPQQKKPSNL